MTGVDRRRNKALTLGVLSALFLFSPRPLEAAPPKEAGRTSDNELAREPVIVQEMERTVRNIKISCSGDGEKGRLALEGGGYVIHDPDGKEVGRGSGPGGDVSHFEDFFDAIRRNRKPHSEIEDAQKSTMLCHLGNMAYRTGKTVHFDPATRRLVDCPEAERLWSRDFRPGWGL